MSTLTHRPNGVSNSDNKIPVDYKDYVNFVSAYKKTGNEEKSKSATSFSNFLEKTKHQKYATVKPPVLNSNKDEVDTNTTKKLVKTEIFIHVNNEEKTSGIETMRKKFECEKPQSNFERKEQQGSPKLSQFQKIKETFVVNSSTPPPPPPPFPIQKDNPQKTQIIPTITIQPPISQVYTPPLPPPLPTVKETPKKTESIPPASKNINRVQNGNDIKLDETLVKKLAYNAMLDMYRASHERAKNYVDTLPKNQVKKENGLQKIIANIAAQGGLDKLTGRSIPKAETET